MSENVDLYRVKIDGLKLDLFCAIKLRRPMHELTMLNLEIKQLRSKIKYLKSIKGGSDESN